MNRRVIQIFCMVVGMVLASSCGDECPVEQPYSVRVSVKDKNYLNISQFPQLSQVDENLPFRTYAGTLYYALYDASTGALIRESAVVSTEGEEKEYTLTFPGVPDGDYKLVSMGKSDHGLSRRYLASGWEGTYGYLCDKRGLAFLSRLSDRRIDTGTHEGKVVTALFKFPV